MNILITGALGHIGSYLINNMNLEHNITVVDNLYTQRYNSLFNRKRPFTFIEKDFEDITIEELYNFDYVIHLAAITNAATSSNNKDIIQDININKTKELIDKVEQSQCRFIFPSSTSVYGSAQEVVDEESPVNPQSFYAESKIQIEEYLKSKDLGYIIFRFGTIFGVSPGMRYHTAINSFCYNVSNNKPLTIWEDNYRMHRPYLGINDCLKAIELVVDNYWYNQNIFNILTDNYKLCDIIDIIDKFKQVSLNFVKTPLINQFEYTVSYKKAQELLSFKPEDNLTSAIYETLKLLGNP